MFLQRISRIGRFCGAAVTLMLALIPVGFCQTTSNQEDEQVSSEIVEEIVVYGEKSLTQLRLELHRAEDKVYALFNLLNSDDEYDIHCYREAPIGSHIKRRVCRANFVVKATSEEARDFLLGQPGPSAWAKIQPKNKLLQEEMEALVERPEFLKALSEFSDANQILESEHQRKCEGQVIICRR
jgi:hypothetical protein